MNSFPWMTAAIYCVFSMFLFYQKLHIRNFRGASAGFALALNISAFFGMITGVSFLLYYGWNFSWTHAASFLGIGMISVVVWTFVERFIGALYLSILGFAGLPVTAYYMFNNTHP